MKIELNKIYCGDCLELMKQIPDKSIDLVLTDPPYGIGIAKNGFVGGISDGGFKEGFKVAKDYGAQNWDSKVPSKEYFEEIFRVSKNQIIFGGNYFVEYLKNSPCWIVWDKKETAINNFADCELIYTSFKTSVRKFIYGWSGFDYINNSNTANDKKQHPTQKPLALVGKILSAYSKENDLILDPFLGSGTTAIACKQLKRNFIGIEISPDYVKNAEERISKTTPPLPF